ncbi:acyl-CoA dehydrogenase family protein [Kibdelosporangium persicum]|uniref:Acyl-[acyl-carrier-protein] dehydrogenase MbtN n=1 Tax=Kibdelosporangium persicum TaxID=2698649 RepID=A0ABX2F777_9PSEU|nr:acyl-CoA dehydrogenase family protein [Kibdelosporangium persicum]NRN67206.1 Citronellyl-CoA dehydrogenase [Kibdelosporangium persicum]
MSDLLVAPTWTEALDLPSDASGREVWRALGRAGLIEWAHPVAPARLGALLAAVDRRFSIGTTLSVCVQLATVLPVLATGPVEVFRRLLAGIDTIALAATDVGAGSDLTALRTEVRITGEGIEVTGEKRWITNATTADAFLVLARHKPGRHFASFTWVLVPASAPGVTVTPADTTLFDGSGTGHVRFDRVRSGEVVGRPGRGLATFARHIGTERLAGALWSVALCRRVLTDTLHRLSARSYGENTLWHLESVRQRFAECLVRLRQLESLANDVGDRIVREHDAGAAALVKASAASTVDYVLAECAHLQGADGFTAGGIQQLRAQAGLFGIGGGATEIVLSTVADDAVAILNGTDPECSAALG